MALYHVSKLKWRALSRCHIIISLRFFTPKTSSQLPNIFKIKTKNPFRNHSKSVHWKDIRLLPDERNGDIQALEKAKVMNEAAMHRLSVRMESVWESFFTNPYKWHDLRMHKRNQKVPDFKHVETGEGLWIEYYHTPDWVRAKLSKLGREAFAPSSTQIHWETLFADPSEWFDYRKIKTSSRQPDFMHKAISMSLWIENFKTPTWAIYKLSNLKDEAFAPFLSMENIWRAFFANPSRWIDNRKTKKTNKHPDFYHKDGDRALWTDNSRTPTWVKPMLETLKDEVFSSSQSNENLWKDLFSNPSKWFDNRKSKKTNEYPDFKRKVTGDALWIEDLRTPAWVFPELNILGDEASSHFLEILWNDFFSNPTEWSDNRKTKKRCSPDFAHKHTGKRLWIRSVSTPSWVATKLNELQNNQGACLDPSEITWSALFANPSKWFDDRLTKKNPRAPDFRHKETDNGLWIDHKTTPDWVISSVSNLESEAFTSPSPTDRGSEFLFVDPSFMFEKSSRQKDYSASKFTPQDSKAIIWINFRKDKSSPEFTMS